MFVDLPGAASQETVPERERDHLACLRYVSGFLTVSVALANPNRHPVPALVVHAHLRALTFLVLPRRYLDLRDNAISCSPKLYNSLYFSIGYTDYYFKMWTSTFFETSESCPSETWNLFLPENCNPSGDPSECCTWSGNYSGVFMRGARAALAVPAAAVERCWCVSRRATRPHW